ncbi:hypothetical protein B0H66DRAFT_600302 [Apodospora peruviana]|uniref:Uncharacterized protein n=1 Tax=Apodospora peruviana TaxID=516989 RepID=A0AAE0IJR5_9PEZI|nr:hypothetical protein B0H66DRAFT_600302 [Apodospora peruviana]
MAKLLVDSMSSIGHTSSDIGSNMFPSKDLSSVLELVEALDSTFHSHHTNNCWHDVIEAIETAKAIDKAKGEKSPVRAYMRKSKAELDLLESLAGMVPDQDGLSILRGGLVTMCKLVTARLELRELILDTFEEIPNTLINAAQAFLRFPDDLDLLGAVERLYYTIFTEVETLIRILLRSHPSKNKGEHFYFIPLVRLLTQLPTKEMATVRRCLESVSRAVSSVSDCSTAALERAVGDTKLLAQDIHRKTDEVLDVGNAILSRLQQTTVIEETGAKSDLVGVIRVVVEDTLNKWDAQRQQDRRMIVYALEPARQTMDSLLPRCNTPCDDIPSAVRRSIPASPYTPRAETQGVIQLTQLSPSTPISPYSPHVETKGAIQLTQLSPQPATVMHQSVDDLLKVLDVPDGMPSDILDEVSRRSSRLHSDALSRGEYLVTTKRFQTWMRAPPRLSDLVLVDGHCADVTFDKVSPMSALCKRLVEALRGVEMKTSPQLQRPAVIVLHHFCGQHTAYWNPLRGPCGLMRSLVHQLLVESGFGITANSAGSFSFTSEFLEAVEDHDVPALCVLFGQILTRLDPNCLVFCFIDGVSELETVLDGWRDELCQIVRCLLELIDDVSVNHVPRAGPALRVLLTSTERSTYLADCIPSERRISLLARNTARDVAHNLITFVGASDE